MAVQVGLIEMWRAHGDRPGVGALLAIGERDMALASRLDADGGWHLDSMWERGGRVLHRRGWGNRDGSLGPVHPVASGLGEALDRVAGERGILEPGPGGA